MLSLNLFSLQKKKKKKKKNDQRKQTQDYTIWGNISEIQFKIWSITLLIKRHIMGWTSGLLAITETWWAAGFEMTCRTFKLQPVFSYLFFYLYYLNDWLSYNRDMLQSWHSLYMLIQVAISFWRSASIYMLICKSHLSVSKSAMCKCVKQKVESNVTHKTANTKR